MLDPLLQEWKIVLVYQILEMNRIKVFWQSTCVFR